MDIENQELILLAGKMRYYRDLYVKHGLPYYLKLVKEYEQRVTMKLEEMEALSARAPEEADRAPVPKMFVAR